MNSSSLAARWLRLLTFRASAKDYESLGARELLCGLAVCWIVGMGRYWDDPRAAMPQHWGVGSVIYVFALALLMWLVIKPLNPATVSYRGFLTFIVMTSPPAILYAIPVEKWASLEEANSLNLWFLLIVAVWRLGLWIQYLARHCRLFGMRLFVASALPLTGIFFALVSLNLHHVVVNLMGGIRHADKSSQDAAYGALFFLSVLSAPVLVLSLPAWIYFAWQNRSPSSTRA